MHDTASKMTQLQALLLCDLVVTTPEGKVQLQGLFDVIHTRNLPTRHNQMWVFFRFCLQNSEREDLGTTHTMRLFLQRPNGETERLPQMDVKVGHHETVQGYIQLQGLPLKEKGEHRLDLFYGEEKVGSCRFFVKMTTPKESLSESPSVTVH